MLGNTYTHLCQTTQLSQLSGILLCNDFPVWRLPYKEQEQPALGSRKFLPRDTVSPSNKFRGSGPLKLGELFSGKYSRNCLTKIMHARLLENEKKVCTLGIEPTTSSRLEMQHRPKLHSSESKYSYCVEPRQSVSPAERNQGTSPANPTLACLVINSSFDQTLQTT